jgi:hypothetical protein
MEIFLALHQMSIKCVTGMAPDIFTEAKQLQNNFTKIFYIAVSFTVLSRKKMITIIFLVWTILTWYKYISVAIKYKFERAYCVSSYRCSLKQHFYPGFPSTSVIVT